MAQKVQTVLIDDAEDVLRVVATHLRLSGDFEVVGTGSTGAEAIELAQQHEPALMLLDLSMPDMDGLTALPLVLDASPGTRVVVLSGFSGAEIERQAKELGAAGFLDKGVPLDQLATRLLKILNQQPVTVSLPEPSAGPRGVLNDEEVLTRHLERFSTVFEQAAIGMATMTLTGSIVRTNVVLGEILNTSVHNLLATNYAELAAESDRDSVRSAILSVGRGEAAVCEIEHQLVSSGRYVHSTFASVSDNDGRPLYLFAQAEDVTRHREALEQLRASEERFRLLVEGVRDYAIFMLDPNGYVSTWNLGAERLKGYRSEEIVGKHFRVFYSEEAQRARHPEHELTIAVREGRYQEEGLRVRKDGSQFVANVLITALFDKNEKLLGFAKVTRDVTEQRLNEETQERGASELQAVNTALASSARAMADFVAMVAHELRSPVATVNGATKLLRNHWDQLDRDEREEMLSSIDRGSERLQVLVTDLLTASRLETGSFEYTLEQISIPEILERTVAEQSSAYGAEVDIQCPGDVSAWGDRARVGQIIANLVSNATKYGAPPITIQVSATERDVQIQVCDHGPGVPEYLRDRLFEKFTHGEDDRGTGLGLYIVRQLARGQGGEVWYEVNSDGGASFILSLAATEPATNR